MGGTPRVQYLDSNSPGTPVSERPSAIVIGNFDGVHRGHQAVIKETLREASRLGLEPSVLTFDPHPVTVIAGVSPSRLTSLERRIELVGELGIRLVHVCHFNLPFAALSPERFAVDLLAQSLRAKLVVVGANFRFGAKRAGDLHALERIGDAEGFRVKVHEIAADEHGAYSSSRARAAIAQGDVAEAAAVLGRPHALTGKVVHGLELGRTFGFPTANLSDIPEMLPTNGVYAVRVFDVEGGKPTFLAPGVMNIGVRPTLGGGLGLSTEAHLFDFSSDLYGRTLRVNLEARLREERKFSSKDALIAQIRQDAEDARRLLLPST